MAFNKKKKKKGKDRGREIGKVIDASSRRGLVNYSKENGGGRVFFYVEKVRSTLLSDETMVDELSSRRGTADWKVFCRDGFSLNGRRNGSNRGDRIEDLISADASEDYIEKLV